MFAVGFICFILGWSVVAVFGSEGPRINTWKDWLGGGFVYLGFLFVFISVVEWMWVHLP